MNLEIVGKDDLTIKDGCGIACIYMTVYYFNPSVSLLYFENFALSKGFVEKSGGMSGKNMEDLALCFGDCICSSRTSIEQDNRSFIKHYIKQKLPIIVGVRSHMSTDGTSHAVVLVDIDDKKGVKIYDPNFMFRDGKWYDEKGIYWVEWDMFDQSWNSIPDKDDDYYKYPQYKDGRRWYLIVYPGINKRKRIQ